MYIRPLRYLTCKAHFWGMSTKTSFLCKKSILSSTGAPSTFRLSTNRLSSFARHWPCQDKHIQPVIKQKSQRSEWLKPRSGGGGGTKLRQGAATCQRASPKSVTSVFVTQSGTSTFSRDLQSANAFSPMYMTELGISTCVRELHP